MMRNALSGKTIAFTGEIQGMSRKQAAAMAQAAGAFVTSSLSGKTDLVIQGDFAGMKAQKAAEMGLKTISAPEFIQMTSSKPAAPTRSHSTRISSPVSRRPMRMNTQAPVNPAMPWETMTTLPEQTRRVPAPTPQFSRAPVTLEGKTVAFTGTLQQARSEASRAANEAGAMVAPTITFEVDYLVCGANPGQTKLDAAEMHETAIISEKQFFSATGQQFEEPMETTEYEMEEETPAPVRRAMTPMTRRPRVSLDVEPTFTHEPVSLNGRTIAFTGALAMSRPEATKLAARFGAMVSPSVTSEVDYLVCGMAPGGTKVNNAHSMGVRTISEEQFMSAATTPVRRPAPKQRMMPVTPQPQVSTPMTRKSRMMAPEPVFDHAPVELDGRTIAFTGTLETATRSEASSMAQTAGADVSSAITHETDFLVCGANPGATKIQAAEDMGIRTISEEQFMTAAADDVLEATAEAEEVEEPMMEAEVEEKQHQPIRRAGRIPRNPAPMSQPMTIQPRAPRRAAQPAMTPATTSLMNKNVVFTGALEMNRLSAAVMATKAGANVASGISSKTDFLVCGPGAGAKMEQAQSMGIPVLTEAQFIAACRA